MLERIVEISRQEKLSHVGSNLGMAQVLEEIYQIKKEDDLVILDAGHSHLAHLVAQEKYEGKEIELPLHDIHCNDKDGCSVGTGSLGLGITVALGRALADRDRTVYCVVSDGGCAEGTVWEALRLKSDLKLDNLKVWVNSNGYTGIGEINQDYLEERLKAFCPDIEFRRTNSDYGDLTGVSAHYGTIK